MLATEMVTCALAVRFAVMSKRTPYSSCTRDRLFSEYLEVKLGPEKVPCASFYKHVP